MCALKTFLLMWASQCSPFTFLKHNLFQSPMNKFPQFSDISGIMLLKTQYLTKLKIRNFTYYLRKCWTHPAVKAKRAGASLRDAGGNDGACVDHGAFLQCKDTIQGKSRYTAIYTDRGHSPHRAGVVHWASCNTDIRER